MADEPTHKTDICEDGAVWKRGLFMLFFLFCFALAEAVLWMIVLVQFFWMLFKGAPNDDLRLFGVGLASGKAPQRVSLSSLPRCRGASATPAPRHASAATLLMTAAPAIVMIVRGHA